MYDVLPDSASEGGSPSGRPRARTKSRLAHEILPADGEVAEAAAAAAAAEVAGDAGPNRVNGENGEAMEIDTSDEAVRRLVDAHAHAHNDYLMSHLGEVGDAARPIPLDSSSFAAFLPHDGLDPTIPPTAAVDVEVDPQQVAQAVVDAPPPESRPNVLSRLKRGPPGSCDICNRTETTVWRKITLGEEEHKVCNGEYN
jgi:hypothetical protein